MTEKAEPSQLHPTAIEPAQPPTLQATPQEDNLEEVNKDRPDPRRDALSAIFESRNKVIEQELNNPAFKAAEPPESEPTSPEPEPTEEPKAAEPPPAISRAEPAQPPQSVEPPSTIPVRLPDGSVTQVPTQQLIQLANIGYHAQQQFLYGQQQAPAPTAPVKEEPKPILDAETAKELAKRLNFGTEEDQVKALQDLGQTVAQKVAPAAPAANPDEIVNRVVAEIELKQNLQTIQAEYPEIWNSRALTAAAMQQLVDKRAVYAQQGVQKQNLELYREVCNDIRALTKPLQGNLDNGVTNPPVQAAPAMKERFERKRAAPQPPAAANKIADDAPARKALTGSDIVNAMRKARGQSVLI